MTSPLQSLDHVFLRAISTKESTASPLVDTISLRWLKFQAHR